MKTSIDKFRERYATGQQGPKRDAIQREAAQHEARPTTASFRQEQPPAPQVRVQVRETQDSPPQSRQEVFREVAVNISESFAGTPAQQQLHTIKNAIRKHPKLAFALAIMAIGSFPFSLIPLALCWVLFLRKDRPSR